MANVLSTILNIIIFLLCLSFVVCIHEAGHLIVAKICNVYCFEYSIGFGPLIFKHKFKHRIKKGEPLFDATKEVQDKVEGETQFSIRALPLGGYVSMAGEDGNVTPEGVAIEKERCLNGVNHLKQIAIMLAGITMNFLLAIILFVISSFLPQTASVVTTNQITVSETETDPAYKNGLRTGDSILTLYQVFYNVRDTKGTEDIADDERISFEYPSVENRTEFTCYQKFVDGSEKTSYNDLTKDCIQYAVLDIFSCYRDGTLSCPNEYKNYLIDNNSTRDIILTYKTPNSDEVKNLSLLNIATTASDDDSYYTFNKMGISVFTKQVQLSAGDAFKTGFTYFGTLFVGIYKALGSLFTPSGWQSVGGIVSVYKLSASGVSSGSASYFLLLWGYISLNLGCFNLLPFPGLDGWQTLMALIEMISRKKMSTKFKNGANTVGLVIMMILAVLLVIKDILI